MQWKERVLGIQLLFGKKSSVLKIGSCGVRGEWVGCNSIVILGR